jgi:hypothetical protein
MSPAALSTPILSDSVTTVGIGVGGSGSAVGFSAALSQAADTTAIMIAIEISRVDREILGIIYF